MKGVVVGQRLAVLRLAPQHHVVLLGGGDLMLGRDVFGGLHHGMAAERIAAEIVHDPVFVRAGAARAARIGVIQMRSVRGAVAGDGERDIGQPGIDFLRGGEQRPARRSRKPA